MTDFEDSPTLPLAPAHPRWVQYARSKLGTHEVAGAGDNAFIVECLKLAGLPASMQHDATAWCGAFAGRCMREVGISPPPGYAAALNWAKWGVSINGCEGAVAVFRRVDPSQPNVPHGHVGFVAGFGPGNVVQVLGGNENNQVMVKAYSKAQLIGYRWPMGVPIPG